MYVGCYSNIQHEILWEILTEVATEMVCSFDEEWLNTNAKFNKKRNHYEMLMTGCQNNKEMKFNSRYGTQIVRY